MLPRDQSQGEIDLPMVTSQEEVAWGLRLGRDIRFAWELLSLPENPPSWSHPAPCRALLERGELTSKPGIKGQRQREASPSSFFRQETHLLWERHSAGVGVGVALLCEGVFLGHLPVWVGTCWWGPI